ncbi:MAG: porin [Telluria sp.]
MDSTLFYLHAGGGRLRLLSFTASLCTCPPLLAQSQVNLYGNLDLGLAKASGQSLRVDRGYNNWIGVKGSEQLGGELAALFVIEARFNPDTGQQERSGTLFQGETTVGLSSPALGTLRLGRALTPLWNAVWKYEPWLNSGFNASLAAYQTGRYSSDGVSDSELEFANFSRASSAAYYTSPAFGPLTVDLAAGTQQSRGASGRFLGSAFHYERGALMATASWERNLARHRSRYIAVKYKAGNISMMGSRVWNHLGALGNERSHVIAATWAIDNATVRMGYGRNPTLGADKLSAGVVHALSKRTAIYADVFHESAGGPGEGAAVGITHRF